MEFSGGKEYLEVELEDSEEIVVESDEEKTIGNESG